MPKEKQEILNTFPNATKNLELSEIAYWTTNKSILASSTSLTSTQLFTEEGEAISEKIAQVRASSDGYEEYSNEWIQAIALAAKQGRVGNCCEKACLAFCILQQELTSYQQAINLELVNNPFLDHFFVVFARNPDTLLSDPRTWNADTIICDPWKDGRSYFIGEIDFNDMSNCPWEAMNYLLPNKGVSGPLLLKREIMPCAHNLEGEEPIEQDVMVLRSRFYDGNFTTHNVDIPMIYEDWDLPNDNESSDDLSLDEYTNYWKRSPK